MIQVFSRSCLTLAAAFCAVIGACQSRAQSIVIGGVQDVDFGTISNFNVEQRSNQSVNIC